MISSTDWNPSERDVIWQKNLIRQLKTHGGMWAVPCSDSLFKVNSEDKTFKLINGDEDNETNKRIAKVFNVMGYAQLDEDGKRRMMPPAPVNRITRFFKGQR